MSGPQKSANRTIPFPQDGFDIETRATPERCVKEGHYKPIAKEFCHDGFTFRQIAREGDIAIYEQTWNGCPNPSVAYEVVRIRRREAREIKGKIIEAAEVYPRSEAGHRRFHAHGQRRRVREAAEDLQMILTLSNTGRLPTLANHCFIVGEAKRADVIWSEGDFKALCEHMLNENPPDYFLSAWIDKASAQARFAKAPRWSRADKRASWAWATITGKAKVQTSIGFYPSNAEQKSRWAAIDFDAHNGEHEQARKRSLEAFSLLLQQPQLYLILCASGNGYHLFIYTHELHPVGRWVALLKQVCEWIGVPITDGTCEIFPNERAESQRVGKAIRAPGTLNPKTGTFSLIEAETVTPLLETLPRTWSLGVGKVKCALPRNSTALSLQKSTKYLLPYNLVAQYKTNSRHSLGSFPD